MIRSLILLGSALMVYNIYGFIRFSRFVRKLKSWKGKSAVLYLPIGLLVLFLLGYLAVGLLGKPDIIVAGILFGGSIFVFSMYLLLSRITKKFLDSERLEIQLMAAEESSRTKANILASFSHEMRTPMNVIIGLNNAVLNDPAITKESRTRLEKVRLSAQHLLGLINNILDMNNIEAGEMTVRQEAFDLSQMLRQINAIVQTLCDEKGLAYVCDAQEEGRFIGDATRLEQVVLSILDNSVKYTDAPGTVELAVKREDESGRMCFIISDTGVGIDADFLPHIFEAFTQEDSSFSNHFGGSGLGLAVAKQVTAVMGGEITVQSEKNVGSVFTVTLPLEPAAPEEAPAPEPDAYGVSLAGRRILIVEDIPENAEIVADLLELEDCVTEHAENGQIGLTMFSEHPPGYYDAILMDLRMPVMDGLEATRRIRALDRADAKDIPILALTANAYESDVKQTFAAGMNAHLAKPADANMLYNSLRRQIGLHLQKERKSV